MQVLIPVFTPLLGRKWQRTRVASLLLICSTLAGMAAYVPAVAQEGSLAGEALVQALRNGGYTLYFRHAATEWSQSDRVNQAGDWTSCNPAQIRQLSDAGRQAAQSVGDSIRSLVIPIGQVLSSPYCRCKETAEHMNIGLVETTDDLMNLRVAGYFGGAEAIVKQARQRLGTAPVNGTNTVLVAHGNLARAATAVYPGEGEGLVFQPQSDGSFIFVGRLSPTQWQQLAASLSP